MIAFQSHFGQHEKRGQRRKGHVEATFEDRQIQGSGWVDQVQAPFQEGLSQFGEVGLGLGGVALYQEGIGGEQRPNHHEHPRGDEQGTVFGEKRGEHFVHDKNIIQKINDKPDKRGYNEVIKYYKKPEGAFPNPKGL